jgi:hypothetical protein
MNSEVEILASMLDEVVALLRAAGLASWAEWFERDADRIRSRDSSGVEHLLTAYGGMGSFNDVVLMSRIDDASPGHVFQAENERLDELRTRIYDLANKLAHEKRA